mgnify:CR=1 FL=1
MRKNLTLTITIVLLSISSYAIQPIMPLGEQEKQNLNVYNGSSDSDYDLSLMNLQVDPLGILFFGPQLSFDFQFANMITVGPYVRWHYAGVLYQAVVTDWFSESSNVSVESFSYGLQMKFLIPVGTGQHRPFFGLGAEKSQGEEVFDSEGPSGEDRIGTFEQNIYHFDFGYRYQSGSAFNLSVSLGLALSQDTENIAFYDSNEDNYDSYDLETRFLPLLQLQLGWQLGK